MSCVFACYEHQARAAEIPLDIITESDNGYSASRLGIKAGVNNAQPEEYLFDTGSDSFNIAVGMNGGPNGPAWFPTQAGTAVSAPYGYMYGDGTYGYLQSDTTVSSVQFYNSTTGKNVASYDTSGGMGVALIQASIATLDSLNGEPGQIIPANTPNLDPSQTYYQNLTWQQMLDQGQAPEEGHFYGTMGAGDFIYPGDNGGVPGQLSQTGYIVEANGTPTTPGDCGQACLIMDLTPALRAQFFTQVPWRGVLGTFPLSGANSGHQFDVLFNYTLNHSLSTGPMPTLLDSGTPNIIIGSPTLQQQASAAGLTGSDGYDTDVNPGQTLTMTGQVAGGQSVSISTADGLGGDQTNQVSVGSNPYTNDGYALYGISFFLHNAVMYDLQRAITGYTPFFVTDTNFTNGLTVTQDMGPLGLAGVISGTNGLTISSGSVAYVTGTNTYTGATTISQNGWLGLGGPGSIAQSSVVRVNGTLDITRSDGGQSLRSLSGNGQVVLGDNTLVLSGASGTFAGSLRNDYAAGTTRPDVVPAPVLTGGANQTHGGLIIAAGQEILTGTSVYTGKTGIGQAGELILTGRLENTQVENAGHFENNGVTTGLVESTGFITGTGEYAGGLSVNSGYVSPGLANSVTPSVMRVDQTLTLGAASTYLVHLNNPYTGKATGATGPAYSLWSSSPLASVITVNGRAVLQGGTVMALASATMPAPSLGQSYTILTATGGVQGTFGKVVSNLSGDAALYPFLTTGVSYQPNLVALEISRSKTTFADAAQTRNEQGVATALDGIAPTSDVSRPVTSLDFAHARGAFNALSGEIHASARTALIQDAYEIRDVAIDRMRAADCQLGAQSGTAKTAVHGHVQEGTQCHQNAGQTLWMQAYGSWSRNGHTENAAGMSNSTGGFVLGADTSAIQGWHVGGLVGYGHSSFSTSARAASGRSDNVTLGGYASTHWKRLGLRMGATYTWNMLSTRRTVAFPGFYDRQNSSYNGGTAQAFADLGYRFDLGRVMVEPFGDVAYINQQTKSFREHGGVSSLYGRGQDTGVTYATFGTRLASSVKVGKAVLIPGMTLGYRHAFGALTPTTREALISGSSDFEVGGVPLVQDAALVKVGVQTQVTKRIRIGVSYTGQYGARYSESGLKGSVSWIF
ncbi:autotransporter domain-containing protein [Acetobacter farinalis]|uniref:Autotransporter domain-containing protein n=1 Tax=Acetobacter farinalis TaxID=1260984 RepID=A0ABT3Q7U3_9PROT|nr:autotransporter outer membrane beta-barrel domain-containing protein [Acetobacter farinalis]MCX2561368.1 autotransporter domain-containing protein [Acetobacter farinalis]